MEVQRHNRKNNKYFCPALTINTSLLTLTMSKAAHTSNIEGHKCNTLQSHFPVSWVFNSALHILYNINQEPVSHSQTDTAMSNPDEIYQSQVIHFAQKQFTQTQHLQGERSVIKNLTSLSRKKKCKPTVLVLNSMLYCTVFLICWPN